MQIEAGESYKDINREYCKILGDITKLHDRVCDIGEKVILFNATITRLSSNLRKYQEMLKPISIASSQYLTFYWMELNRPRCSCIWECEDGDRMD